jgi:hypothetical protein
LRRGSGCTTLTTLTTLTTFATFATFTAVQATFTAADAEQFIRAQIPEHVFLINPL